MKNQDPRLSRRRILKGGAVLIGGLVAGRIFPAEQKPSVPRPKPQPRISHAQTVQLVETEEGPNWSLANLTLRIPWQTPGGDYSDANDIALGPTAFDTVKVSAYAVQSRSWNVTELVKRLMIENTGIYLKKESGGGAHWASRENGTHPAPALHVITTAGAFDPPLIADTFISNSSFNSLGGLPRLQTPMLLKFDLSGVTGEVKAAALKMTTYDQQDIRSGVVIGAYRLLLPNIITDPAMQLGNVEPGIAATVARDADLAKHPSVYTYSEMKSVAQVQAEFDGIYKMGSGIAHNPTFVHWDDIGVWAMRLKCPAGVNGFFSAWKLVTPPNTPKPRSYQRPFGSGYEEMYARYLLRIDPDVMVGATDGVKLPGMAGEYGRHIFDQPSVWPSAWDARMEHTKPSAAHPGVFRLLIYLYNVEHPTGTGSGFPIYMVPNVCLRVDKIYTIEQYIKLNTQSPSGTWNRDGIFRVWLDGVSVYENTAMHMRQNKNAQIQAIPRVNFYHGGRSTPIRDIHYEISGICASSQYIGPPRSASDRPHK